jgi:hypothetical protein
MAEKKGFLWHMKTGYAKIIEKGIVIGGRFQRAAAAHEDRKRREKSKRAFKRISEDGNDSKGGL